MKTTFRLAASLVLLAGIAGCEPLGDGSTAESLELVLTTGDLEQGVTIAATDTTPASIKMYDCFCSNLAAIAKFTNGDQSNFIYRAKFSSSDPNVVSVLNYGDDPGDRCPTLQEVPGLLTPNGVGTATITARFGELSATIDVEVKDTAAVPGTNFTLAPAAPATSNGVIVGSVLPLSLTGVLDGRTRNLRRNVLAWTLTPENADVATVDVLGNVTGIGTDPAGTARTVQASFGANCPVVVSTDVFVGDILGPLSLAREPGLVPGGDNLLAKDSDEFFDITAGLDFDDDGTEDATQLISSQVSLSYEDDCTLRVYDASVPTTNCAETAGTCNQSTPICSTSTATLCPSTLTTACRTALPSVVPLGANRIVGNSDGATVQFDATFPRVRGDETTLAGAVDATTTTLTVAALSHYPVDPPWYAVIDKAGTREDVKVTGVDGTTLTVVRGISGGGAAAPHDAGATFEQRSYVSTTPLGIQGHESTLTEVDVVDPATPLPALGTLQVDALGTFTDEASATRAQRVNRLLTFSSGSPTVSWSSSNTAVASVGVNSGFVTSRTACGGTVTIRARASTSTDTVDDENDPDITDDDTACGTDVLCDQVELCIDGISPLPDGAVCEDGPHDCTP
jgi:hypothetical protein